MDVGAHVIKKETNRKGWNIEYETRKIMWCNCRIRWKNINYSTKKNQEVSVFLKGICCQVNLKLKLQLEK